MFCLVIGDLYIVTWWIVLILLCYLYFGLDRCFVVGNLDILLVCISWLFV